MKNTYVTPSIEEFGSIHGVTGVIGGAPRTDYVYGPNGTIISQANDLGSFDICANPAKAPAKAECFDFGD